MTVRTVSVLRIQIVLRTGGLFRAHTMGHAMTRETKLCYPARNQQAWIRRTVRRVAGDASIGLDRSMFVNERSLLVCVTLDASRVGAGRKSRLFELKSAVGIVTIAALHRT